LKPDVVNLPNLMFIGIASRLREALGARIVCTLSGEDLFLDQLPEPQRSACFELIRERAASVDAYVTITRYYGRHCVEHFGLPAERLTYIPLGVHVDDALSPSPPASPFTIGYMARIAPEKGLMNLARALVRLRSEKRHVRVVAAGYLGAADEPY